MMVLLCVPLSFAQTTQGQLNGRVADSSGAVIPGAQIEITNPATGVKMETVANEAGQYVVSLSFGTYSLRVTAPGFGVNITTGAIVSTASETTVNVELQVASVAEEVTVSAAVAQLETTDTTVGVAIEENLLRDAPIPVSGQKRRPYQYIELSPGVNNTNGRGNIAGSRTNNTLILLDGLSTEVANDGVGESATNTEPSVEAIGEYKLLLSATSAEYGRSSGGMITYATKSGTNDFHGSVWNYHNNSVLNARNWQAVLRQLVAQGMLEPDPEAFGGLRLTEAARPVLRGEQALNLRRPRAASGRAGRKTGRATGLPEQVPAADGALWEALRACRLTLAREQNLPPYVIFHDTTLLEMLRARPATLDAMGTLPGIGRRKLERYGEAFLDVLRAYAPA